MLLVQIKSTVRVTWSQTFLDLIFPMQVSFKNTENFGKQAKACTGDIKNEI